MYKELAINRENGETIMQKVTRPDSMQMLRHNWYTNTRRDNEQQLKEAEHRQANDLERYEYLRNRKDSNGPSSSLPPTNYGNVRRLAELDTQITVPSGTDV